MSVAWCSLEEEHVSRARRAFLRGRARTYEYTYEYTYELHGSALRKYSHEGVIHAGSYIRNHTDAYACIPRVAQAGLRLLNVIGSAPTSEGLLQLAAQVCE